MKLAIWRSVELVGSMESLLNTLREKKEELVDGNLASVMGAFDSSLAKVSETSADVLTQAKEQYEDKMGTAKAHSEMALTQLHESEEKFFDQLKGGIHQCIARPYDTAAVALGVSLLLFPGPRRALYRGTIGMFQSEEAIYRNTESKLATLKKTLESQGTQATAAEASAAAAAQEMNAAKARLKAARSQLASLTKQANSLETQANEMKVAMKKLPGKEALRLRSELADAGSTASFQRSALEKSLRRATNALG